MSDSSVTAKPVRLLHLSDIHFGAEDSEALAAVEQSEYKPGVQAIARQPEAYGVIRQNMILGFALAEALALIGFVAPFVFGV
mgnify:CR=1 FL=1